MKRSKRITALLLTAFVAFSMSACSGKTAEETPDNTTSADVQVASPDVFEIGDSAKKLYVGIDMIEITSDKMNFYFSDLDMSKVDSFYAVKAQDGYTDHFVIVKLNDNAYSSQVSDIFKAYAADLSETYADYAPIEADRAAKAQISVVGDNYVVLIISEDNSAVLSSVKSFF